MLRLFYSHLAALVLAVTLSGPAFADGFSKGSEFQSTDLEGSITVYCNDNDPYNPGPGYAHYTCFMNILDPSESDYFVTDEAVAANKVTLTNRLGDREISKTSDYLPAEKRSKKRFNLWLESLLQTPLLHTGLNTVAYDLKNGSQSVKSGSFSVNVVEQPTRRCRHRIMNSWTSNDCRSGGAVCDRYFNEENYCQ